MLDSRNLKSPYRDWTRAPERGSSWLLSVIVRIARSMPRPLVRLLLYPIVAYFVAFSPKQVAASRSFLSRALNRTPSMREVFEHYLTFARMVLDRVYWLSRAPHGIEVEIHGAEAVSRAMAGSACGAVIISAHFGSFEALRAAGEQFSERRIRPLMYVSNATKIQRVLDAVNSDLSRDVIFAGRVDTMITIRDALAHGDFVGILADRAPFEERGMWAKFMGQPALFPVGAYRLAALLDVPVFFACAVLDGEKYKVFFESLNSPGRATSREERLRWVKEQVESFAQHLERYARAFPFNWFNFYDFWQSTAPSEPREESGALRQ